MGTTSRVGSAAKSHRGELDITDQRLARPTAVMAVGTMLSRATGLGRVIAMTYALGIAATRLADSYNLANTLPNVLYELALGGVLTSVFIPVVVQELRETDSHAAWRTVSALVTAALGLLAIISVLVIAAAPWIIDFFTLQVGGVAGDAQRDLSTFFLRIFAPQIALYGFAAIAAALLNAHGRFAVPMYAPILNNVVVIATFLVFAAVTTGTPTAASVAANPAQKWMLALGTTAGVAAMAFVNLPFLRQLPGRLRIRLDLGHPAIRKLGRLSAWTICYVAVNTAGWAVSFFLASQTQGGVTAYVTAFAFFQLPIGIAAVSIMTALVPKLSAFHIDNDHVAYRRQLERGARITALLMLPATATFVVLAKPMIDALLQHGLVRPQGSDLVADVLMLFAIGLLPFALYLLLMRAFYTLQDARTPALVNLIGNIVTVALDFALFPAMGVRGLALAHSLGYVAGTVLAWAVLAHRLGGFGNRSVFVEMTKAAVASLAAAAAMIGVVAAAGSVVDAGGWQPWIELAAGGCAGLIVFLVAARALQIRDMRVFSEVFGRLVPARLHHSA